MASINEVPDRMIYIVSGLNRYQAHRVARRAVVEVRRRAPRLTGISAKRITPIWGDGWFGVEWAQPYVWYQNRGTRPLTRYDLAGKTVPMWINDPDGQVQRENPRSRTRVTADGRRQTLIFRRAARPGERKWVIRGGVRVSVPRSYPGAPGRIARRRASGEIETGNVGVRWRHPGLRERAFIETGMNSAVLRFGLIVDHVIIPNAQVGRVAGQQAA
jgi:hypothetical protein